MNTIGIWWNWLWRSFLVSFLMLFITIPIGVGFAFIGKELDLDKELILGASFMIGAVFGLIASIIPFAWMSNGFRGYKLRAVKAKEEKYVIAA
jgi:ABC-type glycerol-3-phosphate transport system permease component